jgi:predicted PurR-regulated permease PerM
MPSEVHKLSFLHVLASVVLVVGALYWARAVFVPLALALMLTFLLQPVVAVLVVLLLALLIGAIGWVAVTQLSNLASELPRYQDNLKQKIKDLQQASRGAASEESGRLWQISPRMCKSARCLPLRRKSRLR